MANVSSVQIFLNPHLKYQQDLEFWLQLLFDICLCMITMWTNMETKNVVFDDNVSMAIECEQINSFTFSLTTTMAMAPTKMHNRLNVCLFNG